jgi:hypothetical protein
MIQLNSIQIGTFIFIVVCYILKFVLDSIINSELLRLRAFSARGY